MELRSYDDQSAEHTLTAVTQAFRMSDQPKSILGDLSWLLYLDVLGFRERVATNQDGTYETLRDIKRILWRVQGHRFAHVDRPGPIAIAVKGYTAINPPVVFSDSVFICTKDASLDALAQLCSAAGSIFVELLNKGLATRGAIAGGRLHWDLEDGIHLGEAITNAYDLAESLNAIGLAIHAAVPDVPNMRGPLPFHLKVGSGTVNLRVPIQEERFGLTVRHPEVMQRFDELTFEVKRAGNLKVAATYEVSRKAVQTMQEVAITDDPPVKRATGDSADRIERAWIDE